MGQNIISQWFCNIILILAGNLALLLWISKLYQYVEFVYLTSQVRIRSKSIVLLFCRSSESVLSIYLYLKTNTQNNSKKFDQYFQNWCRYFRYVPPKRKCLYNKIQINTGKVLQVLFGTADSRFVVRFTENLNGLKQWHAT